MHSAVAASLPSPKTNTATLSTLRWNNGESIAGEIAGGNASELIWKSPVFEEPLALRWSALRRVDRTLPPATSDEPFAVCARDGSVLLGDLLSITERGIAMRSARHGEILLKREEILAVQRLSGPNLQFAGPVGDRGWRITPTRAEGQSNNNRPATAGAPAVAILEQGPGGIMAMPYWNSEATLELTLPELIEVEFRITSTVRPEFVIAINADAKQRLRFETWDDELVVASANDFKRLRTIDEKERAVALRVCWNRTTRRCAIYSIDGDLLTEWEVAEEKSASVSDATTQNKSTDVAIEAGVRRRVVSRKPNNAPANPGIVLQNRGRDIALESLRVRAWDGQAPEKLDPAQSRIQLSNGHTIAGQITTVADGSVNIRVNQGLADQTFPLADVESLVFAASAPGPKESELKLTFADGTLLSGRPASIQDGRIALETSLSEQPLPVALEGLRKMLIRTAPEAGTPEPPLTNLDKLVIEQMTLHGTLAGSGGPLPKWQPIGAKEAVTPVKGFAAEITRAFPPGKVIEPAPALFYLSAGDVIPGRLNGIDRSGVELDSNLVEVKRFQAETLDAVQFGAATRAKFEGFLDPGWRVLKGTDETVRRTNQSLQMEPGTAIAHPSALFANEVRFSMQSKNFSCVRLRLFSEDADGSKAPSLVILTSGSRVTAGIDNGEGQFENQNQVSVKSGAPFRVKLVVGEKHVSLSVNNYQVQRYPIDAAKRSGAGLIIEPTSMWGNGENPIELLDFSTDSDIGKTWLPDVAPEAKARALTVPRFRKDDAPRHVLLASNGDLLRGEIEAITGSHFGFRSGLENIRVPRDRVKAAIWLKKGEADAVSAPVGNRVRERLAQRISNRITYGGASLSVLINFLRRQDTELQFKLPNKEDSRSFEVSFGGQSIGDALDEICSLFNVSYRIDDDGVIVIESGPQPTSEMVPRSYWMKTDAFKADKVRDVLAAKGVPFPSGASASWKSAARQLTVVNTPENHQKLAQLLETDFGGAGGSPSHWLTLANGARFGLMIDRFDSDAVIGHHPVYGACRVPLSDIYTVRTSMPGTSEAMRAVADWRLVFAPEPVLPDTPGESSPLLGKTAKSFKLPLLAGGEFDLSGEKGKVVILDFWATWCGPCIKSLPGVIDAVAKLPADRVKLIGVNQGEPPEQVKQFIETRRWALTVALDSSQSVGRDYGVDGIPFTVIIAPDGKVAWVHTGYSPEGGAEITKVVEQLLGGGSAP